MKSSKQESTEERVEVNILQNKVPTGIAVCFRCSSNNHNASQCPFIRAVRFNCRKRGHVRKACRQQRQLEDAQLKGTQGRVKERTRCVSEEESELNRLQQIYLVNNEPIQVKVTVDGAPLTIEVNTRASVSLVSEATYRQLWPDQKLEKVTCKLTMYTGELLKVLGKWNAIVCYGSQTKKLPLVVFQCSQDQRCYKETGYWS